MADQVNSGLEKPDNEEMLLAEQLRLHIQLIREISQMESGISGDVERFSEEITELLDGIGNQWGC